MRRRNQRVRFIDDHDPPAAFERAVRRPIDDVSHVFDLDGAAVARLDDENVRMDATGDADAGRAFAARVRPFVCDLGRLQAVQRLRHRHGGDPLSDV